MIVIKRPSKLLFLIDSYANFLYPNYLRYKTFQYKYLYF